MDQSLELAAARAIAATEMHGKRMDAAMSRLDDTAMWGRLESRHATGAARGTGTASASLHGIA
jgi:hypothetical protein